MSQRREPLTCDRSDIGIVMWECDDRNKRGYAYL